ncbi:MAG TPA: ABC transporter permease [Blastocatellia bacterium]|nr:ABC transporter permease [Blastocatellia bacterium]
MKNMATGFDVRRWVHLRDLLRELVARDIKLRYKRSVLGLAWSLVVPVAQMLVLYFVFRTVLPLNIPNYTAFIFTGLLPWVWFQSSLVSASGAIVDNRELINQVGFPAAVLPVVTVMSQLIHFLLALPILIALLLYNGHHLSAAIVALPLIIVLQFMLTLSLAYLAATLQVSFRDTQYLLGILLFLLFYLTPVFYDSAAIPASYQTIYRLNPMVSIVDAYRDVLLRGAFPAESSLLVLFLLSAAFLFLSYTVFMRAHYRFVEEL